ncbi:protein tamozhennic [Scaptodrosophila lebanonensis]|uniref:Protein tamozhennic n=1 Tax=Drosophila lebanonensis TaxID=7225 RepID=A0A6J2SWM6_DROLE|nr:protein tamozhennic [Scaptodrosophila lebanonensis]
MSDFVPCDILPDLWEEILRRHWTFLETEESIQKLEERKKLEGCLKEFLCVVPHDRKFFLPETGHVLRKSVREMDDFTAQKAIVGFETISQYANNLFTKPWRKEFRVLKTYSGTFQHEVKSNLLDADKLFIAMGYRRTAEDTFVLDGPICPDQVTNVSRDAMAAYVECQIMKHIYAGLAAAGFTCSWLDIFLYRERHVGGTTQSIKELGYKLHEKRLRQEKPLNTENTYSNVATLPASINRCDRCAPYHQQLSKSVPSAATGTAASTTPCALHGNANMNSSSVNPCALHPNGPPPNLMCNDPAKFLPPYSNQPHTQHSHQQQPMTHSRSLEHYNEPHAPPAHRHSLDHQQHGCLGGHHAPLHPHLYETPYDCLDDISMGSSASYAAVAGTAVGGGYNNAYAHPYNAPGNRYPLPFNISNQLNAQYAIPADGFANVEQNVYATIGKPTAHTCNYHGMQSVRPGAAVPDAAAVMQYRQSAYPPDHHLIDFDDRAQLTKNDFAAHEYDYQRDRMYAPAQPRELPYGYDVPANLPATLPQPPQQDSYIYARPVPKSSRMRALAEAGGTGNLTEKYARNLEPMLDSGDNNRKMHKELKERTYSTAPLEGRGRRQVPIVNIGRDSSDVTSYESASLDDFVALPKVKEGVGSFESWNYVFKNLERSGYSKDLGDREDLLVQSLDLDSLTLANGMGNNADKRRSSHLDGKSGRTTQHNGEKSRTLEKPSSKRDPKPAPEPTKMAKVSTPSAATTTIAVAGGNITSTNNTTGTVKKVKSALKNATVDNRPGTQAGRSRGSSNNPTSKHPPPVSTQLIVTSPNEWSCRFCTFLNPDTKRICEMCCRSKDFNLEAAASVSHASSTCV